VGSGKARVMTTKYCVKYRLGKCAVFKATMGEKKGTVDFKTWRKRIQIEIQLQTVWNGDLGKDAELEFIDEDEQLDYVKKR
jgi:putative protease